jgi:hypothetical protein
VKDKSKGVAGAFCVVQVVVVVSVFLVSDVPIGDAFLVLFQMANRGASLET